MATYIIGGSTITEDTGNVASAGNINVVNSANTYQIAGTSIFATANTWTSVQTTTTNIVLSSSGTAIEWTNGGVDSHTAIIVTNGSSSSPSTFQINNRSQDLTSYGTGTLLFGIEGGVSTFGNSFNLYENFGVVGGIICEIGNNGYWGLQIKNGSLNGQRFSVNTTYNTLDDSNGNNSLYGKTTTYNNISTVGSGLPAEYASTTTSAVAIGTTSTVIKTYTPTVAGQFLVVVSVEASTASTISSLTVTYTDGTSGTSTTQTLATSVAVALNTAVSFTALCNATTASAISVQATAAAASDLYASASILAL